MNTEYTKLIEKARINGYTVKATFVECPSCKAKIEAYMAAEGLSERPIFMRATTGVRFVKKGCKDIIACPDGHRHVIQSVTLKESPTCRTEGCHVKIGQKQLEENNGYCWKCRPPRKDKSNMGHAPKATTVTM